MSETQIKITVDDREALASLANINGLLKQAQAMASSIRVNAGQGAGGGIGNNFSGITTTIGSVMSAVKTLGAIMGAVFFGLEGAIKGLSKGLESVSEGIRETLAIQSFSSAAASQISKATGGLVAGVDASIFGRKLTQVGVPQDRIEAISKIAASAAAVNPHISQGEALNKFIISLGGRPAGLKELGLNIEFGVRQAIDQAQKLNGKLSLGQKTVITTNYLFEHQAEILRSLGDPLENTYTKVLGVINKIKVSTQGLGSVLAGISKVAGPLGIGLVGFAAGPVTGVITTAIGATLSARITCRLY